ncbi:hypothetical protein SCAR479_05825 [Seiridium cardinale]|jgi:cAMP-dependent protein kinase regulator
MFYLILS